MIDQEPRRKAGLRHVKRAGRSVPFADRLRGPWRVAVSEESMAPAIQARDWLLIDPTIRAWPRRGAVVVFREPDSDLLAIKRIAAGPGDRVELDDGHIVLRDDEAWLLSDAPLAALIASGLGAPIDSRRYGPVPVACLVGRAWFRYAPLRRIGRISRRGSWAGDVSSGR